MFEIIFDFLLAPGLVTSALLAPLALALLLLGRRLGTAPRATGARVSVGWSLGLLLGLIALLAMESAAVLRGEPAWASWAWLVVGSVWAGVAAGLLRLGRHAAWVGAGIGLVGWVIHNTITAELLFE